MKLYFTQIASIPGAICEQLRTKGWLPLHMPFREVQLEPIDLALNFSKYDLIVLSSKNALTWLTQHTLPAHIQVAVVGNATNASLEPQHRFFKASAPANAADLAAKVCQALPLNTRILLLLGQRARPTLAMALTPFRTEVRVVYHTQRRNTDFTQPERPSMVYFQAPSAVEDYQQLFAEPPTFVAAIGPSTAQQLHQKGWPIHFQPSRPELTCFTAELPQASDFLRQQASS